MNLNSDNGGNYWQGFAKGAIYATACPDTYSIIGIAENITPSGSEFQF